MPAERLILVEYEPHFCRLLARRYPGVRVVQGDAYTLSETLARVLDGPAAAIVSSLPLRTRPERDRLALLADAFDLLHSDAVFVQFTYGIASPMPRRLGFGPAFQAEVSAPIWLNLPPARVWTYRPGEHEEGGPQFRLQLKKGHELLGEELREQGDRFRRKAEKARAEWKSHADRVKSGLNKKRAVEQAWAQGGRFAEVKARDVRRHS